MDAGVLAHIIHNLVLVLVYLLLGSIYLPGFVKRLAIPVKTRKLFKTCLFIFFVFCAYTHFELLIHIPDLPEDFFTWSHNIMGTVQAIGAVGFFLVIHPLIFPKDRKAS